MKCLNCSSEIIQNWSFKELLSLTQLSEEKICSVCLSEVDPLVNHALCKWCSKISPVSICADCQKWQRQGIYNRHQALFSYNHFMHDYFKRYKRYGDELLGQLFEKELKIWFTNNHLDVITYIPSSPNHLAVRGFDPVKELYQEIVPLTELITKEDADKPQAQKNRHDRLLTPQTFKIKADFPKSLLSKKVLIVDDIYTTGRTILHARQLLQFVGFQKIYTFSLSR